MTILAAFDALASSQADRPAIIDRLGRTLSFADLYCRAGFLADEWGKRGIGPGDRVLIAMGVTPDLYAALAALWRLGAVAVLPEPAMGLKGIRTALAAADVKAWIGAGMLLCLAGRAADVNLMAQAGAVVALQGAVAAFLGLRAALILAFPLAYAAFLVPFGDEIVPALQHLTAQMAIALTHFSGVPAVIDGLYIDTPGGRFVVAEECSGVKFLIAMVALAAEVPVNPAALAYINRLSDYLFVLARVVNDNGRRDVKWVPGANR